ncbi:MAG: hypothetical protein ACK4S3_06520 [Parvibaculum sp.]
MMLIYTIRAASEAALIALLEEAQAGKARPFAFETQEGKVVDAARITFPSPEMVPGEPVTDPETGADVTPMEPTGMWVCEVRLEAPDAELEVFAD